MNIWEGVYSSFEEAEKYKVGSGYSSLSGVEALIKRTDFISYYNNTPLPFYSSLYLEPKILDFGGGLGSDSFLIQNKRFVYTIIENEFIYNLCKDKHKLLNFVENVPTNKYDIVHFNSSIQYVKDWKSLIDEIILKTNPDYVIFHDVLSGNFNTFSTLQNFYDSKIPVWFLNSVEFVEFVKSLWYKLIYYYECRLKYFGIEQNIPMVNLPENCRINTTKGFVFKRV